MHTGGMSRGRVQDGRRSDLTLTAQARRPICDANIPSQEELRLLVQPGTCTPILPNAQENRAFVRLRTTIYAIYYYRQYGITQKGLARRRSPR